MFRYVARHNADWATDDDLVAEGDYGEVMQFDKTQQPEQTYGWESYVPEPQPPQPL